MRFYIYDLFLNLKLKIENKEIHELGYYNKIVSNTVNHNNVIVDYDLIAKIKARNAENINNNIVLNSTLNIFKIEELRQRKKYLEENSYFFSELNEFNRIMKILNINI